MRPDPEQARELLVLRHAKSSWGDPSCSDFDRCLAPRGRRDAPGVYVGEAKLAAVGLRVRRYCSYHGIAVNVSMDLESFGRINPCGFEGLEVTQLSTLCGVDSLSQVRADLETQFERVLG